MTASPLKNETPNQSDVSTTPESNWMTEPVTLSMPFDVVVDLHAVHRMEQPCAMLKTSYNDVEYREIGVVLTVTPTRSLFYCNAPLDDATMTMSNIRIKFEKRERTMVPDETYKKRILELTAQCMTEQQCAGAMLYGDIYVSLHELRNHGFTINTPDIEVARMFIIYFASLFDDPTSVDVYHDRHLELHGGSSSDKVCSACWAVGDFKECQKCNMGIYTCSAGCHLLGHSDLCRDLMKFPLEQRTPITIQSLQMTQVIRRMDEPEVFNAFSKPALSRICAVCGIRGTLKCGTCMKTYYCSKACQTLAYPAHRRLHH